MKRINSKGVNVMTILGHILPKLWAIKYRDLKSNKVNFLFTLISKETNLSPQIVFKAKMWLKEIYLMIIYASKREKSEKMTMIENVSGRPNEKEIATLFQFSSYLFSTVVCISLIWLLLLLYYGCLDDFQL